MNAPERQVRRLILVDAALASPEGLDKRELADELGMTKKSVQRMVNSLKSMGFEIVTDSEFRDHYVDRRRTLFSAWAIDNVPAAEQLAD